MPSHQKRWNKSCQALDAFPTEFHGLQFKKPMACGMLHVLSILGGKIWKLHRDLEWCASGLYWTMTSGHHCWGISHVVWQQGPILCTCSVGGSVPLSKGSNGRSLRSLLNTTFRVFLCYVEQLLPCVMTGNFMTNISWWVTL